MDWREWSEQTWGPLGAGPASRRARFFESGEVRLALLALLAEQPRHGYELMKELESRSGGVYRASAGTVYPTLQQLSDEGLIASEPVEGRTVYRLTEAGRKLVEREQPTIERVWRRARRWEAWADWMGPEAAVIAGPAAQVMQAAIRAVHGRIHDPGRFARVHEILESCRRALAELEEAP